MPIQDSADVALAKLADDMYRHPPAILRDYAWYVRDGMRPLRTVAHVLGERLNYITSIAQHHVPIIGRGGIPLGSWHALDLIARMERAIPFLWTLEMAKLACTSELPRHIVGPELMPYPEVWFTYVDSYLTHGDQLRWNAHLFTQEDGVLMMASVVEVLQSKPLTFGELELLPGPQVIVYSQLTWGQQYPDDFPEAEGIRQHAHDTLAIFSFLNSPFVTARGESLNRRERRSAGIIKKRPADEVHFIELRTPLSRPHEKGEGSIEWQHRWLVRAHHRAQWCPSTQSHRVIWIAPHIKGPADKPLKETAYLVHR